MRLVHWVVTVPATVVAVAFSVSNRESVSVTLWPLPGRLDAPLYLVVLLSLAVGFLIGEFVAWINAGRARRLARERARRIDALEHELAATQANLTAAEPNQTALVGADRAPR